MLQNDERILRRSNVLRRRDLPIAPTALFQKESDGGVAMGASRQLPPSLISSNTSSRRPAKTLSMSSRQRSGQLRAKNRHRANQLVFNAQRAVGNDNRPRQFPVQRNIATRGQQQQALATRPRPDLLVPDRLAMPQVRAVPPPPPIQFVPPHFL
ncbi:unnamed protein product [Gongylonema pulchrum]|uniref:Uncharacterized protein n=1 Tax=Gongylonema pulchrum TaxID=637853 RepID=A0A183D0S5_9BILA|nr:unnamed protein product [Gongylonema pulchrum]